MVRKLSSIEQVALAQGLASLQQPTPLLKDEFGRQKQLLSEIVGAPDADFERQRDLSQAGAFFDVARLGLGLASPTKEEIAAGRRFSPAERLAQVARDTKFFESIGARAADLEKARQADKATRRAFDLKAFEAATETVKGAKDRQSEIAKSIRDTAFKIQKLDQERQDALRGDLIKARKDLTTIETFTTKDGNKFRVRRVPKFNLEEDPNLLNPTFTNEIVKAPDGSYFTERVQLNADSVEIAQDDGSTHVFTRTRNPVNNTTTLTPLLYDGKPVLGKSATSEWKKIPFRAEDGSTGEAWQLTDRNGKQVKGSELIRVTPEYGPITFKGGRAVALNKSTGELELLSGAGLGQEVEFYSGYFLVKNYDKEGKLTSVDTIRSDAVNPNLKTVLRKGTREAIGTFDISKPTENDEFKSLLAERGDDGTAIYVVGTAAAPQIVTDNRGRIGTISIDDKGTQIFVPFKNQELKPKKRVYKNAIVTPKDKFEIKETLTIYQEEGGPFRYAANDEVVPQDIMARAKLVSPETVIDNLKDLNKQKKYIENYNQLQNQALIDFFRSDKKAAQDILDFTKTSDVKGNSVPMSKEAQEAYDQAKQNIQGFLANPFSKAVSIAKMVEKGTGLGAKVRSGLAKAAGAASELIPFWNPSAPFKETRNARQYVLTFSTLLRTAAAQSPRFAEAEQARIAPILPSVDQWMTSGKIERGKLQALKFTLAQKQLNIAKFLKDNPDSSIVPELERQQVAIRLSLGMLKDVRMPGPTTDMTEEMKKYYRKKLGL